MGTFFMLGKYSAEAIKGITKERTKKVIELIEKSGGKVNSIYAVLGEYDLVLIVDFPGVKEVMKASVGISKLTGISFTTLPAVTVEEFDKLAAE